MFPDSFYPDSWNAPDWWVAAAIVFVIALPLVVWANWSQRLPAPMRIFLSATKALAIALLVVCLLEPMETFTRPEPGSNSIVVMADASQSLNVKDRGDENSRAERLHDKLDEQNSWLQQLDQQFELRRYEFDSRLNAVTGFEDFVADGNGSSIAGALEMLGRRLDGKPSAGIVLLTDGNASDVGAALDLSILEKLPPVYPVVVGKSNPARDISITGVTTSQTNFESAPVTIKAEPMAFGHQGSTINVELLNAEGKQVEVQEVRRVEDGKPFAVRFQLKPTERGVNVFEVRAFVKGTTLDEFPGAEDSGDETGEGESSLQVANEATLINNRRTVMVDRGRGPFRILYLGGRPNWEYKFMRRALQEDVELNLVGLLRVAKREPKFSFRGHMDETTNPLYRGFGNQEDATAEQHDEPVLIRLDNRDAEELRDGFPGDSATLFEYDAVVLDDIEAAFFTQDQKTLLSQFVTLRGGGLLMLGGMESFAAGGFDRTPIGEALPVYLDNRKPVLTEVEYRLDLTRDGWVQPWARIESTREREEKRLEEMPGFKTLNVTRSIKPGATVLANVIASDDSVHPALVVQRFGKGRTGAMLIGDLWRWNLRTPEENDDLNKSWRQTLRWLVSDVPRRVEVTVEPAKDSGVERSDINVQVFDDEFKPQLNSEVAISITSPSGQEIKLTGDQDSQKAGRYKTSFISRETGAYRVVAEVKSAEGDVLEKRESGWVSEPAIEEFRSLVPDRKLLESIADATGGEVIELDDLDSFASSFDNRKVPVTETKTRPWWHRWTIFLTAVCLLITEWGVRRMRGLA